MPRPARILLSKSYYHVMTRGNNRNIVFRNDEDYAYYLELIARYKKEHPFDLFHYCLMPTHVHQLAQTGDARDFAIFMKKINLAYFHHYRQAYGWVGHFWQDRYKSQAVGKDAYFIQAGKYIELNPLRKGLVEKPQDYRYSSYSFYAFGTPNDLITPDFFYKTLGKNNEQRRKKYQDLIMNEAIVNNYHSKVWGSFPQRKNEYQKHHRKQTG